MLKKSLLKYIQLLPAGVLALTFLLNSPGAYAFSDLIGRSITIGSSVASANTTHTFSFIFPVSEGVGSISFEYCTDPIDTIPCVNPAGSDVSGAALANQSGETGFALISAGSNQLVIGRTPANVGGQANSYEFTNVVNPSGLGPFFVRISAYGTSDASGPLSYFSSVAASINQGININTEVPDILYFCAAVIIPENCGDASGDFIEFGILRTTATSYGTSQFLVGSNAVTGYTVSVNGPTMTSGSNIITNLTTPTPSQTGNPQFGLNLVANTAPTVGALTTGGSGAPTANYSLANKYAYNDGDVVAEASGRSTIEIYTVSYIVNVPVGQPSGIYNTTITYVCTASF
ncbi:MAG TPA: hypothetical protein VFP35_02500 [Candidatus Saccharimonadales bacterium]|nr:hypothetical protein [Candidatus Saccharimonadales bacterium]